MASKLHTAFKFGIFPIYFIAAIVFISLILSTNYLFAIFSICKTLVLNCLAAYLLINLTFKNCKYFTVFVAAIISALLTSQTSLSDLSFAPNFIAAAVAADTVTSAPNVIEDDLLDARCQSKCLYELEKRHKVCVFSAVFNCG